MAYTLKDSQITANDNLYVGGSANIYKSSSFVPGSSYTLTKIEIPLAIGLGSPSFDINVYLYSDDGSGSNGKPSTLLATSTTTLAANTLTSSFVYYPFLFSGYALTNGTKYHIVVKSSAYDASNHAKWSINSAEASNATCISANGSSWSSNDSSSQGDFKTYETEVTTYTVTYNGNGNTGGAAPSDTSSPYEPSAEVTVLGIGDLVKADYQFVEWNTAADGSGTTYQPANTFSMPAANVTLYAIWTLNIIVIQNPKYGIFENRIFVEE